MKKALSVLLAFALVLAVVPAAFAAETIKVGASATPHAEILEVAKEALAAEGYDLQIVVYDENLTLGLKAQCQRENGRKKDASHFFSRCRL